MIWPPPNEPLEGELVRLEPIAEGHRAGLLAASRDPETWRWIAPPVAEDEAVFQSLFDHCVQASSEGSEWCFTTISKASGEPVGGSSYLNIRAEHDGLEIGRTWLQPSVWRTGVNVEAKLLMLTQCFEVLGAARVEFKTDARNERSRGALGALPAQLEGILRNHMTMPGIGVRDSAYFSIVEAEWPEVRDSLRKRLELAVA